MEVGLFPNLRRPGIGLRPHREGQRPLLPQHARHCPVLEAGSALGFLVHPPLNENESYHVEYEGEGRYRFVYSVNPTEAKWEPVFSVAFLLPVGGMGAATEEVTMLIPATPESRETALLMASMFIVANDLGAPAGAVTLRGAWNFQTPPGWDTVYTPIFNMIERPVAPMLVIRVETDWFVHDTEFRYVLQPGEAISASYNMPIGQVLFVPREEITLRDGTEEEMAARRRSNETFFREKVGVKLKTAYGLEYSPHYLRTSRLQSTTTSGPRGADVTASDTTHQVPREPPGRLVQRSAMAPLSAPEASVSQKAGRNDPARAGAAGSTRSATEKPRKPATPPVHQCLTKRASGMLPTTTCVPSTTSAIRKSIAIPGRNSIHVDKCRYKRSRAYLRAGTGAFCHGCCGHLVPDGLHFCTVDG